MNRPKPDVLALVVGLIVACLGVLALWEAFDVVPWDHLGVVAPLGLVAVGLVGVAASRSNT